MRWNLGIEEIERIKSSITDLRLFDSLIVIDDEAELLSGNKLWWIMSKMTADVIRRALRMTARAKMGVD